MDTINEDNHEIKKNNNISVGSFNSLGGSSQDYKYKNKNQ